MAVVLSVLFCLLLSLFIHESIAHDGLQCSSAPFYANGFTGEIIQSWNYKSVKAKTLRSFRSHYVPRYTEHVFAPEADPQSTKYHGLDLFKPSGSGSNSQDYITMKFQREALVYIVVQVRDRELPTLSLAGWKSEEWIRQPTHNKELANLGVYKPAMWRPSKFGYVFSKQTSRGYIQIPGKQYLARAVSGTSAKLKGTNFILVAEADGSPTSKPSSPPGVPSITAGSRCPTQLHELWRAPVRQGEGDVGTRTFRTSHPIWDPCYWCAYDHEHGSVPLEAMNYSPRFGYIALKNKAEFESHNGFKGIMSQIDNYILYYGFHGQLSAARRFTARFHSVIFAVVDANTKELVMELGHKGDFGFLATRKLPTGHISVNEEDAGIKAELRLTKNRSKRIVNVINPENLNPNYKYNKNLLRGRYEQWLLRPMCANPSMRKELVVDFKTPHTALKEPDTTEVTILGKSTKGVITKPSDSINRDFVTRGMEIGDSFCGFTIPANGEFFTDKLGTTQRPGPGKDSIRQFIKPGFSLKIVGRFMASDIWVGMHENGWKGKIKDVGYAIDPTIN